MTASIFGFLFGKRRLVQAVLDGLPQLIFVKDGEGRFVWVNAAFAKFLGRKKQQIIGKKDEDFNHRVEDMTYFLAMDKMAFEQRRELTTPLEFATEYQKGPAALFTYKNVCLDGKYVFGVATPIAKSDGLGGLIQTILDAAPDGIYVMDRERRYTLVNQKMVEIFGLSNPSDLLGKIPEDKDIGVIFDGGWKHQDELLLREGNKKSGTTTLTTRDGKTKTLESSRQVVTDSAGSAVGILGFIRDISQMQENAEAQVLSEFLTRLAHQLKNRLFTFETNFKCLKEELNGYKSPAVVDMMAEMAASVDELRKFMSEVGTQIRLRPGPLTAVELEPLITKFANQNRFSDVNIISEIQGSPVVNADETSLREILVEMVTNSRKHILEREERPGGTGRGCVFIRARDESSIDLDCPIVIEVEDNGVGVSADVKRQIFERGVTRTNGGWGVGLADIYQTVCERFGGTICECGQR